MPLYEFRCTACDHRFEALVMGERPRCAACGAESLEKLFSTFAVSSGGASAAGAPAAFDGGCGTCGDPRGPGSCRSDG